MYRHTQAHADEEKKEKYPKSTNEICILTVFLVDLDLLLVLVLVVLVVVDEEDTDYVQSKKLQKLWYIRAKAWLRQVEEILRGVDASLPLLVSYWGIWYIVKQLGAGRTKKIGQENLGDFFFVSDRVQKKGRIIKMYKLIDLIDLI